MLRPQHRGAFQFKRGSRTRAEDRRTEEISSHSWPRIDGERSLVGYSSLCDLDKCPTLEIVEIIIEFLRPTDADPTRVDYFGKTRTLPSFPYIPFSVSNAHHIRLLPRSISFSISVNDLWLLPYSPPDYYYYYRLLLGSNKRHERNAFQPLQQKIFSASHLCRPDNCFSEESSTNRRPYHLISSRLGERGGWEDDKGGASEATCLFGRKLAVNEEIQPLGDWEL